MLCIQAIAGPDPKDPYTRDVPVPQHREALDGNIQGVKVGVNKERAGSPLMDPEFGQAITTAIGVLGALGASVEGISLPLTEHAGAITMAIILVE